MAIRIDTDLQAVYILESLGHTVPAATAAWTVGGLYRLEADVNLDTLVVARYGELIAPLTYVGLYLDSDGVSIRIRGDNGGGLVQSSVYTLTVGQDYRLALDYNGSGTVRMLLDGVAVLTLSFTPAAGTSTERSLQWGGYGEVSGYTSCTIARWRMWSAVLSEAEHRAEYRSLSPVRTSGLLHNWPMDPGSGRMDDTVSGEADLAENPAVPVGDGTAFVHRASIIGTPQFFDLGSTTTPGAQSVTVPTYAERVAIFFHESDDAGTPDSTLSSLTSNFAGTFTIDSAVASSVAQAVAVATATVSSTGSKTFTPVFTAANLVAGAGCWVVFLQDVGSSFPTATDVAQASGAGATAGTASASGLVNGLAIAVDTRLDAATSNYPANQSGWTSLATGQETGPYTYWACSRIRQKFITSSGTETATTQNTNGSCVSLLTVPSAVLVNGYTLEVTPGAYSVTGSSARTLAGRKSRVTPGSYALTGSSARTLYARRVLVTPGAYSLTGSSGTLIYSRPLVVTPGSYSIAGSDGALSAGLLVNVTPGSYAVSGADVELVYTPVSPSLEINVTPGGYGFTGSNGALLKSSVLNVTPGAYSLSGANAGLLVGKVLSVDPGAYALTGSTAALLGSKVLGVDPGAYAVTGSNVELEYVTPNKELIVTPGVYVISGTDVELSYVGGSNLTQAAPGLTPKVWPGLSIRYEGKPKRRLEELEEEERERIEEIAEQAVIEAANERTKKAMKASLQASMRAAEIEIAATSYLKLVEQAALLRMDQIEEEDIAVALLLM